MSVSYSTTHNDASQPVTRTRSMLWGADIIVAPTLLVAGVAVQESVFAAIYLALFFAYFAIAVKVHDPVAPDGDDFRKTLISSLTLQQTPCRRSVSHRFLGVVAAVAFANVVAQIVFSALPSQSLGSARTWEIFGLRDVGGVVFVWALLPQILLFVASVPLAYVHRKENLRHKAPAEIGGDDSGGRVIGRVKVPRWFQIAATLALFLAGTLSPNVLSSMYFLTFLSQVWLWSVRRRYFRRFSSSLNRIGEGYTVLHVYVVKLFQFRVFHENMPRRIADIMGLHVATADGFRSISDQFSSRAHTATYAGSILAAVLLFVLLASAKRFYVARHSRRGGGSKRGNKQPQKNGDRSVNAPDRTIDDHDDDWYEASASASVRSPRASAAGVVARSPVGMRFSAPASRADANYHRLSGGGGEADASSAAAAALASSAASPPARRSAISLPARRPPVTSTGIGTSTGDLFSYHTRDASASSPTAGRSRNTSATTGGRSRNTSTTTGGRSRNTSESRGGGRVRFAEPADSDAPDFERQASSNPTEREYKRARAARRARRAAKSRLKKATRVQQQEVLWEYWFQSIGRFIRYYGRIVCQLVIFVACLIYPDIVALGLLALLFLAIVLPTAGFNALSIPLFFYASISTLLQFVFSVPSLVPSRQFLDKFINNRDLPPFLHLLVGYLPVFVMALYYKQVVAPRALDREFKKHDVMIAARRNDVELLEAAFDRHKDVVRSFRGRRYRQTLLHVYVKFGHSELIPKFAKLVDINARDVHLQTALHLARTHHNDAAFDALIELGADDAGVEHDSDDAGGRWQWVARALKAFREFWLYVWSIILSLLNTHAQKISIVLLYVTGMQFVDYVHFGYLVFFVVFFSSPNFAKRTWILVVIYCELSLGLLYAWRVVVPSDYSTSQTFLDLERTAGFVSAPGNDPMVLASFMLISVVGQLYLYRSNDEQEKARLLSLEIVNLELFVFKHGSQEDASVLWVILFYVLSAFRYFGLVFVYLVLALVFCLQGVSVPNLGYLATFLLCMVIHMFSRRPWRTLRRIWFLVVIFAALVLSVRYACQFDQIFDTLEQNYPAFMEDNVVTLEEFGLVKFPSNTNLFVNLLPPTAVFGVVVTQFRMFLDSSAHVPAPSSRASRRLGTLAQGVMWIAHRHFGKVTAIITFVLVIYKVNLVSFFYLLVVCVCLQFRSGLRKVWVPLGLIAAFMLPALYVSQFSHAVEHLGDAGDIVIGSREIARFLGFLDYPSIIAGIYVEVTILVLVTLQAIFQRWFDKNGAYRDPLVHDTSTDSPLAHHLELGAGDSARDFRQVLVRYSTDESKLIPKEDLLESGNHPTIIVDAMPPRDPQAQVFNSISNDDLSGPDLNSSDEDSDKALTRARDSSNSGSSRDGGRGGDKAVKGSSEDANTVVPKVADSLPSMSSYGESSLSPVAAAERADSLPFTSTPTDAQANAPTSKTPTVAVGEDIFVADRSGGKDDASPSGVAEDDGPPPKTPFWRFLSSLPRRVSKALKTFYKYLGLEITISVFVITAFYRNTVISLIYVGVVVALYAWNQRALLARMWTAVVVFLAAVVLGQYFLSENFFRPNGLLFDVPLSEAYRQWLSLEGYDTHDLPWDFMVLFFAALQAKYMRAELDREVEVGPRRSVVAKVPVIAGSDIATAEKDTTALIPTPAAARKKRTSSRSSSSSGSGSSALSTDDDRRPSRRAAAAPAPMGNKATAASSDTFSSFGAGKSSRSSGGSGGKRSLGSGGNTSSSGSSSSRYESDAEALKKEKRRRDPIWTALMFVVLYLSDKVVLALIFYAGVARVSLLTLPYLIISFVLLFGPSHPVTRFAKGDRIFFSRWRYVNMYNVFHFIVVLIYQIPALPAPRVPLNPVLSDAMRAQEYIVAYQEVVGLEKFCRNGFSCNNSGDITQGTLVNPFTFDGAVAVIVIFILVNFQLKLLYSKAYDVVLEYNAVQRRNADFRGRQSALLRRHKRLRRYEHIEKLKRLVQTVLKRIFSDSNAKEIGLESMTFDDRELWFKPPRPQTAATLADIENDSDDSADDHKGRGSGGGRHPSDGSASTVTWHGSAVPPPPHQRRKRTGTGGTSSSARSLSPSPAGREGRTPAKRRKPSSEDDTDFDSEGYESEGVLKHAYDAQPELPQQEQQGADLLQPGSDGTLAPPPSAAALTTSSSSSSLSALETPRSREMARAALEKQREEYRRAVSERFEPADAHSPWLKVNADMQVEAWDRAVEEVIPEIFMKVHADLRDLFAPSPTEGILADSEVFATKIFFGPRADDHVCLETAAGVEADDEGNVRPVYKVTLRFPPSKFVRARRWVTKKVLSAQTMFRSFLIRHVDTTLYMRAPNKLDALASARRLTSRSSVATIVSADVFKHTPRILKGRSAAEAEDGEDEDGDGAYRSPPSGPSPPEAFADQMARTPRYTRYIAAEDGGALAEDIREALRNKRETRRKMTSLSTVVLLLRVATSHVQYIAYFGFIINAMAKGSVLSTIPALSIFGYALMERSRAPRGFWQWIVIYTQLVLALRFMFQLPMFCEVANEESDRVYSMHPDRECIKEFFRADINPSNAQLVGLYKVPADSSFSSDVYWNLICLLFVAWTRFVMKSKGVWHSTEEYLGDPVVDVEYAERCARERAKSVDPREERMRRLSSAGSDLTSSSSASGLSARFASLKRGLRVFPYDTVRRYYFSLFVRDENGRCINILKPGRDFYFSMFSIEVLVVLTILFGYSAMTTPGGSGSTDLAQGVANSRFSGTMVIFLFLQIFIMVLDRSAYLLRSLELKLMLQYFTLVFFHVFVFFVWPSRKNDKFGANALLVWFYIAKCAYWIVSAAQIRVGYPSFDPYHDRFTREATFLRALMFKVYRAIPFVFELRTLLDWMCTKTSLDLWETLKLEDIFASMYIVKCDLLQRSKWKRGEPKNKVTKFFSGTLLFAALMVVILLPLLLFSTASPGNSDNNVLNVAVGVSLRGQNIGETSLLTISATRTLELIDDSGFADLRRENLVFDEPRNIVQTVEMVPFDDNNFGISDPSRLALIQSLLDFSLQTFIRFTYTFTRPGPPGAQDASGFQELRLNDDQATLLANVLSFDDNVTNITSIELGGIYPEVFRLGGPDTPELVRRDDFNKRAFTLTLQDETVWYLWNNSANDTEPSMDSSGVNFVTISERILESSIFSSFGDYSIVTIYVTVVLTIGRFLRMLVADMAQRIIFEDLNNVDSILQICEAIFLSRTNKAFMREESLFRKLIRVFRDPNLLLRLTRRKQA